MPTSKGRHFLRSFVSIKAAYATFDRRQYAVPGGSPKVALRVTGRAARHYGKFADLVHAAMDLVADLEERLLDARSPLLLVLDPAAQLLDPPLEVGRRLGGELLVEPVELLLIAVDRAQDLAEL